MSAAAPSAAHRRCSLNWLLDERLASPLSHRVDGHRQDRARSADVGRGLDCDLLATQALPGNAAYAVLGHGAAPQRLKALENQLELNRSLSSQYESWIGGVLHGNLEASLANGESLSSLIGPRLENSAVLVIGAGIVGTLIAGILGLIAAARRDRLFDHIRRIRFAVARRGGWRASRAQLGVAGGGPGVYRDRLAGRAGRSAEVDVCVAA